LILFFQFSFILFFISFLEQQKRQERWCGSSGCAQGRGGGAAKLGFGEGGSSDEGQQQQGAAASRFGKAVMITLAIGGEHGMDTAWTRDEMAGTLG
jgi:hypothetical protein